MKLVFIVRHFDAQAGEQTATAPAKSVLTSENLTALKTEYKAKFLALAGFDDPFSEAATNAKLELWKVDGLIKSEESKINKELRDAEIAEQRNARLGMNTKQLDAYAALIIAKADKKTPADKLAQLETDFATAKEAVDNELLAKYAASKPAAAKTDGTAKTSDGGANKTAILELARAGKTRKEIEEMGFARATVWFATDDAKKAGETFPNIK